MSTAALKKQLQLRNKKIKSSSASASASASNKKKKVTFSSSSSSSSSSSQLKPKTKTKPKSNADRVPKPLKREEIWNLLKNADFKEDVSYFTEHIKRKPNIREGVQDHMFKFPLKNEKYYHYIYRDPISGNIFRGMAMIREEGKHYKVPVPQLTNIYASNFDKIYHGSDKYADNVLERKNLQNDWNEEEEVGNDNDGNPDSIPFLVTNDMFISIIENKSTKRKSDSNENKVRPPKKRRVDLHRAISEKDLRKIAEKSRIRQKKLEEGKNNNKKRRKLQEEEEEEGKGKGGKNIDYESEEDEDDDHEADLSDQPDLHSDSEDYNSGELESDDDRAVDDSRSNSIDTHSSDDDADEHELELELENENDHKDKNVVEHKLEYVPDFQSYRKNKDKNKNKKKKSDPSSTTTTTTTTTTSDAKQKQMTNGIELVTTEFNSSSSPPPEAEAAEAAEAAVAVAVAVAEEEVATAAESAAAMGIIFEEPQIKASVLPIEKIRHAICDNKFPNVEELILTREKKLNESFFEIWYNFILKTDPEKMAGNIEGMMKVGIIPRQIIAQLDSSILATVPDANSTPRLVLLPTSTPPPPINHTATALTVCIMNKTIQKFRQELEFNLSVACKNSQLEVLKNVEKILSGFENDYKTVYKNFKDYRVRVEIKSTQDSDAVQNLRDALNQKSNVLMKLCDSADIHFNDSNLDSRQDSLMCAALLRQIKVWRTADINKAKEEEERKRLFILKGEQVRARKLEEEKKEMEKERARVLAEEEEEKERRRKDPYSNFRCEKLEQPFEFQY